MRLVCELARKANDAGLFTLVLARDQAQAEELDELLWAFDNDAYIPHQIAGEDMDEEEALVLIAVPEHRRVLIAVPGTAMSLAPAVRALVINLRMTCRWASAEACWSGSAADPEAREPLARALAPEGRRLRPQQARHVSPARTP